jgi:hypothetical protein
MVSCMQSHVPIASSLTGHLVGIKTEPECEDLMVSFTALSSRSEHAALSMLIPTSLSANLNVEHMGTPSLGP